MSCSQFGYSSNPATTQLLMAGQTTGQQLHGTSSTTGQPCCESGRPVMTDPITGQTVCSCQYDAQLLNYQRLAASGLPLNMYGTAAAAAAAAAAYGGEQGFLPLSAEQSAFYSPSANGFDLKDNLDAWRSLPYAASVYYPYESAALAGYPFPNGYAVDLNGARRKNATRETTSTLKAWLNEHRKNPYPTKGEKIMLAIITKMTLTQVSTWFANARRRLKKENKMTWSPRNRCDDDDPDGDDGDGTGRTKDGDHDTASKDGGSQDDDRHGDRVQDMEALDDGKVEFVDVDDDSKSCESAMNDLHVHTNSSDKENRFVSKAPTISPVSEGLGTDSESSQASLLSPSAGVTVGTTDLPTTPKPRIWSLVDTATSGNNTTSGTNSGAGSSSLPTVTSPGAARLSPLQRAARLEYLSPYPKPAAWYSGTLGSISATNGVPGSFPLSAVYTCPPMVNPASLSSMASPVTSTGSSSLPGSAVLTESSAASAVSSLNRLRTAAAAFPTVELHGKTVQSGVGTTGGSTVFGLAVPGGRVVPATTVAPSGASAGQNRVVS